MSTPAIERMSWEEKLRALEELWDAITREGDRHGRATFASHCTISGVRTLDG